MVLGSTKKVEFIIISAFVSFRKRVFGTKLTFALWLLNIRHSIVALEIEALNKAECESSSLTSFSTIGYHFLLLRASFSEICLSPFMTSVLDSLTNAFSLYILWSLMVGVFKINTITNNADDATDQRRLMGLPPYIKAKCR